VLSLYFFKSLTSKLEAIHLEEQGERYRTGERAERYYVKAAEMYGKAFSLNDKDADCVYNWYTTYNVKQIESH
jgi:hypothetical protein